eukprot:scaffold77640_cov35-Prasinocladus_malaysianus.AAC.3
MEAITLSFSSGCIDYNNDTLPGTQYERLDARAQSARVGALYALILQPKPRHTLLNGTHNHKPTSSIDLVIGGPAGPGFLLPVDVTCNHCVA